MDSTRKRIPFRFKISEDIDGDNDDNGVLDEQQQEAVIKTLKDANNQSNRRHRVALRSILALSLCLQFLSFHENPLSIIVPPSTPGPPPIPLSSLLTMLSILVHVLALLTSLEHTKLRFRIRDIHLDPLSYQTLYILSVVAPALSLILGHPWQSTVWWSVTTAVVFTAHSVMSWIEQGNKSITELESMRYVAPGA